jgi:hypothetical protein
MKPRYPGFIGNRHVKRGVLGLLHEFRPEEHAELKRLDVDNTPVLFDLIAVVVCRERRLLVKLALFEQRVDAKREPVSDTSILPWWLCSQPLRPRRAGTDRRCWVR